MTGTWFISPRFTNGKLASGKIEAVSNAESGFFRPVPLPDGNLVVFHYTGKGFVPAVIEPRPLEDVSAIRFLGAELAAKHPIVTTWQVPPPSTADPAAIAVTGRGPYLPLRNLGLRSTYPVVQGYKNSLGLGWRFDFEDPLRFSAIGITGAYSVDGKVPAREKGHLDIDYRYLGWHAGLSWNRSDFYDLFGPTKRSRRGYAASLGYDYPLIYDLPRRLDIRSEVEDQVAGEGVAQIVIAQRRAAAIVDPRDSCGALQPAPGDVAVAVRGAVRGYEHPVGAGGEWCAAAMVRDQISQLRDEWDVSDRCLGLGRYASRGCIAMGPRQLCADVDYAAVEVNVVPG